MTGFVLIGCTAVIAFAILTGVTIYVQAWERVQMRRTDNWVTVNREGLTTQRNIIRDTTKREPQP